MLTDTQTSTRAHTYILASTHIHTRVLQMHIHIFKQAHTQIHGYIKPKKAGKCNHN